MRSKEASQSGDFNVPLMATTVTLLLLWSNCLYCKRFLGGASALTKMGKVAVNEEKGTKITHFEKKPYTIFQSGKNLAVSFRSKPPSSYLTDIRGESTRWSITTIGHEAASFCSQAPTLPHHSNHIWDHRGKHTSTPD